MLQGKHTSLTAATTTVLESKLNLLDDIRERRDGLAAVKEPIAEATHPTDGKKTYTHGHQEQCPAWVEINPDRPNHQT